MCAASSPRPTFIVADGTDFVRVDPEYDHCITGGLRIAHLGEASGLDVLECTLAARPTGI
jgi:hypothetical protein